MPRPRSARPLLIAAALVLTALGACGGPADDDAVEDTLAAIEGDQSAMAAPTATPATDPAAPIAVADIDRWQRGMEAELRAVQEASEQLKRAANGTDTITAMYAANETSTRAAGASAAGLDENRYGRIRSTFESLVLYMVPLDSVMDVSGMAPEMAKAMQESRAQALARESADVPADVLEALRPRAAELRRQQMALVGERMKAAGIGG